MPKRTYCPLNRNVLITILPDLTHHIRKNIKRYKSNLIPHFSTYNLSNLDEKANQLELKTLLTYAVNHTTSRYAPNLVFKAFPPPISSTEIELSKKTRYVIWHTYVQDGHAS